MFSSSAPGSGWCIKFSAWPLSLLLYQPAKSIIETTCSVREMSRPYVKQRYNSLLITNTKPTWGTNRRRLLKYISASGHGVGKRKGVFTQPEIQSRQCNSVFLLLLGFTVSGKTDDKHVECCQSYTTCDKHKFLIIQCQCLFCLFGSLLMETPESELTRQTLREKKDSLFLLQQHSFAERNPPRYSWHIENEPT